MRAAARGSSGKPAERRDSAVCAGAGAGASKSGLIGPLAAAGRAQAGIAFLCIALVTNGAIVFAAAPTGDESAKDSNATVKTGLPDSTKQVAPTESIAAPSVPQCTSEPAKVYEPRSASLNISVSPSSAWRPVGGDVELYVSGDSVGAPANLLWYRACFRWHDQQDGSESFEPAEVMRWKGITKIDSKAINLFSVAVPSVKSIAPGKSDQSKFWILRRADFRVNAVNPKGVSDITLPVKIISVPFAIGVSVVVTALAFIVLWRFSVARGLTNGNFLLNVVATSKGYASLSQFQIMVWTLVTGAGAVYVISLSGNLINIGPQMLILLGITGITVIGSKLADNRNGSTGAPAAVVKAKPALAAGAAVAAVPDAVAGPPAGVVAVSVPPVQDIGIIRAPAAGVQAAVAPALHNADAMPALPAGVAVVDGAAVAVVATNQGAPCRRPKWSDLVIIDPDGPPGIDVTRVQIFFFPHCNFPQALF
jgi:hypothetical protein